MPGKPIEALRRERDVVLELYSGLGTDGWQAPSGCPGWSVKDLLAHLGALYWAVVDPSALPDTAGLPTEEAQEALVRGRRTLSPEEVLADYDSVSSKALDALSSLLEADFEVPLGDLGTYAASSLPNAFCFDHYTHIRMDLFPPRGPFGGEPPPSDELQLEPALDWIEAALPQQNAELVGALEKPVALEVTGAAARSIHVGPPGEPAGSIRSGGPSLVRWVTQRGTWEESGVEVSGDARALQSLARLRVF